MCIRMLEQGESEQSNAMCGGELTNLDQKFAAETPSCLIASNELIAEFMQLRIEA